MPSLYDTLIFLFDPSSFGLILIALFTIANGAYRSRTQFQASVSSSNPSERNVSPLVTNSAVVKKSTVIILPIIGSIILVLLFYYLSLLYYFIFVILMFGTFFALCFVQWPIMTFILRLMRRKIAIPYDIEILRCIGRVNIEFFLSLPLAFTLLFIFFLTNSWIIVDIFSVCIAIFSMAVLRVPNLRVAILMLTFFFFYDIFWVFISSFFFGSNVMVTVAKGMTSNYQYKLPMSIQLPALLYDGANLLGMGDIVLPGFFLCFLYRFDMSLQGTPFRGYFINSMVGYAVGLFLALVMLASTNFMSQPALLYLGPCTLIPCLILGFLRGDLKKLLMGSSGRLHTIRASSTTAMDQLSQEDSDVFNGVDLNRISSGSVIVELERESEIVPSEGKHTDDSQSNNNGMDINESNINVIPVTFDTPNVN